MKFVKAIELRLKKCKIKEIKKLLSCKKIKFGKDLIIISLDDFQTFSLICSCKMESHDQPINGWLIEMLENSQSCK